MQALLVDSVESVTTMPKKRKAKTQKVIKPIRRESKSFSDSLRIPMHRVLKADEENELAQKYKNGDASAGETLLLCNQRFVAQAAWKNSGYGISVEDLYQEGMLGLMRALEKYEPSKKFRFGTYAIHWIKAFIRIYVMNNKSLVKIGTTSTQRMLFFAVGRARRALEGVCPEEEIVDEMAKVLKVTAHDVRDIEQRMRGVSSLDTMVTGADDRGLSSDHYLKSALPGPEEELVEKDFINKRHAALEKAMGTLSARERFIIENRWLAEEPMTLSEIGDKLGFSREYARQVESAAKTKMKAALTSYAELSE